ncbi:MAG: NADH:flavin oxidoreductase [Desulfobacterales bacterium]|nr:NADH:flavin oxidoreductase [Desulfobacterales bacterium]
MYKNKFIMAPVATNMCDENGIPTEAFEDFYLNIAKGGIGGIILGATTVCEGGGVTRFTQRLHNQEQGEALKKIVLKLKQYCPVGIQLFHVGGQGNPNYTGFPNLAPSKYCHPPIGHTAKEMSETEIKEMQNAFINSCNLAFKSGCDFVELHCAHGYLIHEFLSLHFNHRKDRYGISEEGRSRFLFEILERVQEKNRIGLRLSGEDFVPHGLNMEFYKWLIPKIEPFGLLYYHITAGIYDSAFTKKDFMAKGGFQDLAKQFKNLTKIPIITVGNIKTLRQAEDIIFSQKADMIAMARALICDPMMPIKSFENRLEEIRICKGCNRCHYLSRNAPGDVVICRGYNNNE